MVVIHGHFDGKVLVPDGPVDLPRDQKLVLHVAVVGEAGPSSPSPAGAWGVLEEHAGSVEAPADWSAEHDHYLYGTPKRREPQDP
jgi:hypothetical protein